MQKTNEKVEDESSQFKTEFQIDQRHQDFVEFILMENLNKILEFTIKKWISQTIKRFNLQIRWSRIYLNNLNLLKIRNQRQKAMKNWLRKSHSTHFLENDKIWQSKEDINENRIRVGFQQLGKQKKEVFFQENLQIGRVESADDHVDPRKNGPGLLASVVFPQDGQTSDQIRSQHEILENFV